MKEEHKKKKRIGKIIAITCAIVIGIPVLTALSYIGYVVFSYHRVGNTTLDIKKDAKKEKVQVGQELSLTTYNIGFGSYSPDYTFFMDLGYDENGVATAGVHGKGISKEDVQTNTDGSINIVKELVSDFYALQEVDVDSDRAYHINQKEAFEKEMTDYDNTFAINFDSAYLFYPFNDPHGKSKAGLSTYSKYSISESERKEYTISTGFSKFFDLDRCFSVNRIAVENGKDFVFINSHMSAYDEGGTIRDKQIDELYSFMKSEYDKGNYVIAAGDFNHDLLTNNPLYPQYTKENFAYKDMVKQPMPDWLNFMFDDNKTCKFDDGFTVYAANNEPSCRDCDVAWQRGYTYVSTVDGFIVSENITVNSVETKKIGDNGFAYSDHQPSTLKFNF
ncbi:MAG: endonuclease/exonuclease/phosphatase family protein [Bacilli bacterium]|nr:endonuclease/exonuclease/phosphatase family protein [Bacilli bacterium]